MPFFADFWSGSESVFGIQIIIRKAVDWILYRYLYGSGSKALAPSKYPWAFCCGKMLNVAVPVPTYFRYRYYLCFLVLYHRYLLLCCVCAVCTLHSMPIPVYGTVPLQFFDACAWRLITSYRTRREYKTRLTFLLVKFVSYWYHCVKGTVS